MAEKQDEFVFDPSHLLEKDDQGQIIEEEKPELNLFKDKFFEETDDKKESKTNDDKVDDGSENIEKKDDDTPSPDKIKNKEDLSSSEYFSVVLGQDLMERGVLSSFDQQEIEKIAKEQGEEFAIAKMIEDQAAKINEDLKSSYDSEYQNYLDMVQGGVSKEDALGIQQLENFNKTVEEFDLKGESEESVQARKDLLTLNYRLTTKWNDEKIANYVNKLYDQGSDIEEVDEAKENLEKYINYQKEELSKQAEENKRQQKLNEEKVISDYKSTIEKSDEFFKGEKVTSQTKKDMEKLLLTPVKLDNGQVVTEIWAKRLQDPVRFDTKIAYLTSIGFFDDKPLDKFYKNAETKVTSRLGQFLSDNKGNSYTNSLNKSFNKKDDVGDFLDSI